MNTQSSKNGDALRGPIAWMVHNPIAANLAMLLAIVGGIWAALGAQKEVLPEFQLDVVEVRVEYPGAAPREVEQGILLPVEEAVRGVQGIEEVTSTAEEGSGLVSIELLSGTDRMRAFQDIDQAVTRIRTFPEDIERPEVMLQSRQREVVEVGLYGDADVWTLRQLAENLRDLLLSDPHVTQVEIDNVPPYVTHVEIPAERLREYGLTLGEVAELLERSSENLPAGSVQTHSGEILLRMQERKQWARQFEELVLTSSASGSPLRLGDLATITDGFEEVGFHGQFNQQPSVELQIYRVGDQSPLEIAEAVNAQLESFRASLPPGIHARIDSSAARDYEDRLSLLLENAALAVVIVLGILALFLELRLAFWVMMGMVASFAGGLLLLPVVDVSINMISMFGFLVVLGIVVDDAVVVGENVHEQRRHGRSGPSAAIVGTRQIARPVVFSILTNLIAFVPLVLLPGSTGKYWKPLPLVVMLVLLVSLAEALFVLPAHLAHVSRPRRRSSWFSSKQRAFADWVDSWIERRYRPLLASSLNNRYLTLVAALAILAMVGGYGYSGHMGLVLMPEVAADEIEAGVTLPVGTTRDQAAKVARDITQSTQRMFERHDLYAAAEGIKTNVRGDNFIDVEIVMKPPDERQRSADDVIELWRDEIGDIEGVDQITFEAERGPGGYAQDISVDLSHADIDVLERASRALVERMKRYTETRDVSDNYDKGKTRLDLQLLPEGRALGLTSGEVGQQVRDAFYGALALRQLRGTSEVEVRVKLPEAERKDLASFEGFLIRTPQGTEVPLDDVVHVRRTEAFASINRRDGRRVVSVGMDAEPDSAVTRLVDTLELEELPKLRADFPGLTWSFEGSQSEMRDSTASLWGSFGLAMAVIYSLLAVAFRSYSQPLIVMIAIPFGVVGAVLGHILLGYDLSLVSLMGVIALSGVVVNDSLILIDHANANRENLPGERAEGAGQSRFDAILAAGTRRFRPILLTTLTTFGGLTPIILETSNQARHLIPMAISLGFGIVFATAIILLVVPCLYLIVDDLRARSS